MKIGILTFHDGMNHGGYLQAFATTVFLKKCGHDVSVINYKNAVHHRRELQWWLLRYNPMSLFRNVRKIRAFRRAQKRLPLTAFTMRSESVRELKMDVIVIGSDVVWNFLWPVLGGERIYFGENIERSKLVAFAPSFGPSAQAKSVPDDIADGLRQFHALSVRDKPSLELMNKVLPGRDVRLVLDPTFLIDWEPYMKPCKLPDRYLLVYAYNLTADQIDEAKRCAQRNDWVTVAVGYHQSWCDINLPAADPFEYLFCFKHAASVFTGTFHGVLFAIHFRRAFFAAVNPSIADKTTDLLERLGLEDRLAAGSENVVQALERAPDYDRVGQLLREERARTTLYLSDALQ